MGDLDISEFTKGSKHGGKTCWYLSIDATDEQRAKLDKAMAYAEVSNTKIAEVLSEWGLCSLTPGGVGRHRFGRCACD